MTSTCRVLLFLGLSVAGPAFRLRAQEAPAPNTRPVRSLASAITTSEADIEAVKARLLETRQRISDERVSKQTALAKLEEDIVRLRRECGAQASAERSAEDALRARADEALQLVQVLKSAWNGLVEVRRTTETHFTLVDRVVLARQLEQAEALLDRQGATLRSHWKPTAGAS